MRAGAVLPPAILAALLPPLLLLLLRAPPAAAEDAPECAMWAKSGECSLNADYMLQNCADACAEFAESDRIAAEEIEKKIGHINSFFELEADDIDKKPLKFDSLKGKVTVITNVASYCGYTETHYRELVQLYDRFKADAYPVGFEILAFPCNQFGEQEPEECPAIKRFAREKGVEFTMMDKVDVNGVGAHPVYHYLKKVAGPSRITWNFATYYVVTPEGVVTAYAGVEPMDLVPMVLEAMGAEEESADNGSEDYSYDDDKEEEEGEEEDEL